MYCATLDFAGAQYVKCRAQRCTESSRQYLFPGHVDTNSLVVQDEYVFTQVCVTLHYLINLNQSTWSFHPVFFYFFCYFGLLCEFMLFHHTSCNGFPHTHLFPTGPVCVLIMFCLVHVKTRSMFQTYAIPEWELWIGSLVSLLPFILTLTPIRQKQSVIIRNLIFSRPPLSLISTHSEVIFSLLVSFNAFGHPW